MNLNLSTMPKKYFVIIGGAILGLLILIIIYAKIHTPHQHKEAIAVSTSRVQQRDITLTTNVVGNVEAHATINVKSLVDGHITSVTFKEGDFVKTGQTLFTIDSRPFVVKLNQAKATLAGDQAKLTVAALAVQRNSKLLPFGYISKQDFAQLQANQLSLAATVKADQAAVTDAELQLSYCTITAPVDGRTGSLLVNVGNLVKANDQNPLVIINQITPIDVKFSIPEKQLFAIKDDLSHGDVLIQAYLEENPKVIKSGKVVFIDNTVDTQSGMIMLKASFPNTDQYFWPGQFVKIVLPLTKIPQAIVIPTRAIQMGQEGAYVFVVDATNHAILQPVVLGPNIGDETVITKGLQPNTLVVTEGQSFLSNGAQVKLS